MPIRLRRVIADGDGNCWHCKEPILYSLHEKDDGPKGLCSCRAIQFGQTDKNTI